MRDGWKLLLAIGATTAVDAAAFGQAVAAPPSPVTAGLPPIACVEAVRVARIARDGGDAASARTKLDAAIDLPGCGLPALAAMLPLLRAGAYPSESAAALRARLTARLEDPATDLPDGLLTQIALRGVPGDDDLLLGALERRLARGPAADGKPAPPGLVELLDVTAELQQRRGKLAPARETLARLMALQPSEALQWRALFLDLMLGSWSSAAELLATMVDAPDAPATLREMYVRALAHLGRFDEMTKQIEKLAPPPSTNTASAPPASYYTSVLVDAAWALRDAGRDAEAQATFRRVLAHQPEHAEAQLALLHLYGTAEERAAQAAAVAARRAGESDPFPLFEEGSDLLGAGDAKGARELLARAAPQLVGTDYAEPAWYNLGSAAFKLESWEEAANAFAAAIAVNPGRVESHYKRGIALFHLERCADAVIALRRTLELQPDRRDAHYYLAGCYRKLGDAAAAAREDAIFNAKP